jgi:hypothetical protein
MVESEFKLALHSATIAKTWAKSGPTASIPSTFVVWWWQLAYGMPRKEEQKIYAVLL